MSMPWRDPSWQLKTSFKSFSALCLTTQWLNSWFNHWVKGLLDTQLLPKFSSIQAHAIFFNNTTWITYHLIFCFSIPYGPHIINIIIWGQLSSTLSSFSLCLLLDWTTNGSWCLASLMFLMVPICQIQGTRSSTKKQVRTQVRLSEAWSCGLSDKRLISNSPLQPPLLLGSPTIALAQEPRCPEKFSVSSFYLRLSFLHHRPGHIGRTVISST